jgi:hypothetical protein
LRQEKKSGSAFLKAWENKEKEKDQRTVKKKGAGPFSVRIDLSGK